LHLDTGNGVSLEKVDNENARYDSTVAVRVRSTWKKFCEYLPILTGKGFSLKLTGKVYATCVRSCLMHDSETWPRKVEHELKMNRTEMNIMRWMCGVNLNERKKSKELRELLGLEPVSLMIKKSSLKWFGHVERKDDNDWVKRCITWQVEGIRQRGCQKKTWWDCVNNDMESLGLSQKDTQSRNKWRRRIKGAIG